MIKIIKNILSEKYFFAATMIMCSHSQSTAADLLKHEIKQIEGGFKYAIVKSSKISPLVIVLGITRETSLDYKLTPIINNLEKKGVTLVTIDIPCHGDDAESYAPLNGLLCWPNRIRREGNFAKKFASTISRVIDDVRDRGLADTQIVSMVGISRGAYISMWAALGDDRIKNIIALAPVTELTALAEFKNFSKEGVVTNFNGHYKKLSKKSIFIQVSNLDGRISTSAAIRFIEQVGASQPINIPVDLTAIITPKRGHTDAEHVKATDWLLDRIK